MKKFILSALFASIALTASAAPAPKATGDADFVNGNVTANITFNAINTNITTHEAKGSLIYTDPNITYSMDVEYLLVAGNHAWFAGKVTSVTGNGECCQLGSYILYEVIDNGEPGIGQDIVYGQDLGQSGGVYAGAAVLGRTQPGSPALVITDGNIQVH